MHSLTTNKQTLTYTNTHMHMQSITFFNHVYDTECSAALVKVARDAGQPVPDWLLKTAKKKPGKNWNPEMKISTKPATKAA